MAKNRHFVNIMKTYENSKIFPFEDAIYNLIARFSH